MPFSDSIAICKPCSTVTPMFSSHSYRLYPYPLDWCDYIVHFFHMLAVGLSKNVVRACATFFKRVHSVEFARISEAPHPPNSSFQKFYVWFIFPWSVLIFNYSMPQFSHTNSQSSGGHSNSELHVGHMATWPKSKLSTMGSLGHRRYGYQIHGQRHFLQLTFSIILT